MSYKPGAYKTMRSEGGRERDFRDITSAWPYNCSDKVNRIIMALTDEVGLLMKERDAAIAKYHSEIHEGRKRCEGIVSVALAKAWDEAALYASPNVENNDEDDVVRATQCGLRDILKARAEMERRKK